MDIKAKVVRSWILYWLVLFSQYIFWHCSKISWKWGNSTFAPWFIYFVTQWFKLTFYPNKRKKTLLIFLISTSNHMFKRQIWDKFTEFTFLSETREISKFQKMNEINFSQISRINMWFLVNHIWQALKEHARVRIAQKTINQYPQI